MSIENSQWWIPVRYQISAEFNTVYKIVSPYHIQIILVVGYSFTLDKKQPSFPQKTHRHRTEHGTCFGGSVRGIPKIAPSHWIPQWWTWDIWGRFASIRQVRVRCPERPSTNNVLLVKIEGPVWYTIYHHLPVKGVNNPLFFHQPTNGKRTSMPSTISGTCPYWPWISTVFRMFSGGVRL